MGAQRGRTSARRRHGLGRSCTSCSPIPTASRLRVTLPSSCSGRRGRSSLDAEPREPAEDLLGLRARTVGDPSRRWPRRPFFRSGQGSTQLAPRKRWPITREARATSPAPTAGVRPRTTPLSRVTRRALISAPGPCSTSWRGRRGPGPAHRRVRRAAVPARALGAARPGGRAGPLVRPARAGRPAAARRGVLVHRGGAAGPGPRRCCVRRAGQPTYPCWRIRPAGAGRSATSATWSSPRADPTYFVKRT